jgi:SAM-dependent MidA family methyltransferase
MTNPRSRTATASSIQFSPEQSAHVNRVIETLRRQVEREGGWISFADFMRTALYAPGLGYYAAGAKKFGAGGDFITAPTLTPLFGQTVARSLYDVLYHGADQILELGAGTGALAHAMLSWLSAQGMAVRYTILEVSPDLRARQEERLAAFATQVNWISELPATIHGVVIANEVLDAVPCERVYFHEGAHARVGVMVRDNRFVLKSRVPVASEARELQLAMDRVPAQEGYLSEINVEAEALVHTVTERMQDAIALWLDYGFPRAEYYHPQRRDGTMMCHVQHRTHSDVFFAPGLQDITAHVDFTAMAHAARNGGASQIAYVSQAQWLLESGLLDGLAEVGEPGSAAYLTAANAVNRLVSPAEMGELFKVMMVVRGNCPVAKGFLRDQSYRL